MIDHILPVIKEPADYITALSLYRADPLTAAGAGKLLEILAKYQGVDGAGEDMEYLKLCLAVDLLLGGRGTDTEACGALELSGATLDALLEAWGLALGWERFSIGDASRIWEQVQSGGASQPARVLLARLALDSMAGAPNFVELQEPIRGLAGFLTDTGPDILARYAALVGEVRLKCRK